MIHVTTFDKATGEILWQGLSSTWELAVLQETDERGVITGHWDKDTYRLEPGHPPRVVKK